MRDIGSVLAIAALVAAAAACGGDGGRGAGAMRGSIETDGSSTVEPITEAMAEEFGIASGGTVGVTVGRSGTGGGFKRFCTGETAISNASRPITDAERDLCQENGVAFLELPIALDGLAVLVNTGNGFAECLTMDEMKRVWEPGSRIRNWNEIRPEWPAQPLALYGPGTNSGTFDFFTEEVVGDPGASRADYTASEDDNVLVQGVAGDANALGYFGYAYYEGNRDRLKVVAVDRGEGCIQATDATVRNGTYPLARPLFIYVNQRDLRRPEVAEFVRFYNLYAAELVPQVGYVALAPAEYEANLRRLPGAN